MAMWMVRAGRGGVVHDSFKDRGVVAVGWSKAGDAGAFPSREALRERLRASMDDNGAAAGASVLWRFVHEIEEGDAVLTYDPGARVYAVGRVIGSYRFDPAGPEAEEGNPYTHLRDVRWEAEVARDGLSQTARGTLGSISTLFRIRGEAEAEIHALAEGREPAQPAELAALEEPEGAEEPAAAPPRTAQGLAEEAAERVKDRVAALDPNEMEQFVAGLLRALGYSAEVSPRGPDRGSDILATPDPLGVEDPRIHVEVKHRAGKAGPDMIRSFLGGRRAGDRGVFVSTGGFTREARYEADRAAIPVRLMTLDDLVRLLLAHYDALDGEMRAMVPLRRLYWPL